MASDLWVVGLSHINSPVAIREKLSWKPEETALNAALRDDIGAEEAAVLSTCSRFEIYAALEEGGKASLFSWLERRSGQAIGRLLYAHKGLDALSHLFRVAAGLDSWVVGETEILGQVKDAYQRARDQGTAGRWLHRAFQKALYAGKKIRSETGIVGGIASIGGAASLLARRIFSETTGQTVLVFGAGAMAESTARHLRSKGATRLLVSNRSLERARALAERLVGEAMGLESGLERLAEADVAVVSTAAPDYLIGPSQVREAVRARGGRPLFLIDLSVPRNIDPASRNLAGVYLYDIDDLKRIVDESLALRREDCAKAESMVAGEARQLWESFQTAAVLAR
ncbi:MAG: glutamyl-tRNA reductase [Elusimicrobia bacterium]|nr:glutamyl-tRNA reductase [Elusimicrobiota bacterium]